MKLKHCFFGVIAFVFSVVNQGECLSVKDVVYQKSASRAAKALEKKFGLHCCGTGAEFKDKIEIIGLSFQYCREIPLDKARNCILNIMNEYISLLNSYSDLLPYMSQNPITKDNVEVKIFFSTRRMGFVDTQYISIAAWTDGKFSFYMGHNGDYYKPSVITYEEYDEALEKAGVIQRPKIQPNVAPIENDSTDSEQSMPDSTNDW